MPEIPCFSRESCSRSSKRWKAMSVHERWCPETRTAFARSGSPGSGHCWTSTRLSNGRLGSAAAAGKINPAMAEAREARRMVSAARCPALAATAKSGVSASCREFQRFQNIFDDSGTDANPVIQPDEWHDILVRAEGLEPSLPCGKRIFVPTEAFATPASEVCGLDYPFALATCLRRRPSSLYTFPGSPGLGSGIANSKVSPNLSGSTPAVSRWALNFQLSPLRPTHSATPASCRLYSRLLAVPMRNRSGTRKNAECQRTRETLAGFSNIA